MAGCRVLHISGIVETYSWCGDGRASLVHREIPAEVIVRLRLPSYKKTVHWTVFALI